MESAPYAKGAAQEVDCRLRGPIGLYSDRTSQFPPRENLVPTGGGGRGRGAKRGPRPSLTSSNCLVDMRETAHRLMSEVSAPAGYTPHSQVIYELII